VIINVNVQDLRNRWTSKNEPQYVIEFADGHKLVLSNTMQDELVKRFGRDSDGWIEREIALGCVRDERRGQWNKVLLPEPERAWVSEDDARARRRRERE
jgi:hypothetical protein